MKCLFSVCIDIAHSTNHWSTMAHRNKNGEGEASPRDALIVENLIIEIRQLKEEMTSLKLKFRNGLYLYEVKHSLYKFEKNLALYLYPRDRIVGTTEIFPRLMNWLELRRNTPQGEIARNKWLQVRREIEWNQNDEAVLGKLRNLFPDLTQPVETWNPISLTPLEERCVAELVRLSDILTDMIEREENEREEIAAL